MLPALAPPLRSYAPVTALALVAVLLTVAVAAELGHPLKDPDGVAGPAWLRLPALVLLFLLADVVPRVARRSRACGGVRAAAADVVRERWPLPRLALVGLGLAAFYTCYVAYRNLKSFLPFVRDRLHDDELAALDRLLLLGADPGPLLHDLLGTGVTAHVLSAVYLAFLAFVPLSLAAALVWSRSVATGALYVTALGLDWLLGAASYYLLPSLGPVFAEPALYARLPETGVSRLQEALYDARLDVLADPVGTQAVHGIAGFASLHVAIVLTGCLVARRAGLPAAATRALWVFFALTVVSTVYFGWHYLLDDVAGALLGWAAVAVAARATGFPGRRGAARTS